MPIASSRGLRVGAALCVALALVGAVYVFVISDRSNVPKNQEAMAALAAQLVGAARSQDHIGQIDLEVMRLLAQADHRIPQLTTTLTSLAAQATDQEPRIEDAFTALHQGDAALAEIILAERYEVEKSRPEAEIDLVAIAATAQDLAALMALRDTEAALNIFSEAASAGTDLPRSWARLGHISQREGRNELAVRAYDMALFLAGDEAENKPAVMTARAGLGLIAMRAGDIFGTSTNSGHAAALAEELNDKPHMAVAYTTLGQIHILQGPIGKAEEYQRKALTLEEELGRAEGLAVANDNIGEILLMHAEYENAAIYQRAALALYEALDHRAGIARQAANLGSALKALGDVAAACNHWTRALPLFEETNNPSRVEQMQVLIRANNC